MATAKTKRPAPPRRPEKKIGPFHNGLGIAIWLNSVETEAGPRCFRSYVAKLVMWRDPRGQRFLLRRLGSSTT